MGIRKISFYQANDLYQRGSILIAEENNSAAARFMVRGFGSVLGDYKTNDGWRRRADYGTEFFVSESISEALKFINSEAEVTA